jgi:DNA-binding CsgD family transcriptional regulator
VRTTSREGAVARAEQRLKQLCCLPAGGMVIVHAPSRRDVPDSHVESGNSGMFVADGTGRVLWISPSARPLLQMALGQEPALLPAELLQVASRMARIEAGDPHAPPPVWPRSNEFGLFTFSAYWLRPTEPGNSLIGFTVSRRVPKSLRLFEALGKFSVPTRQAEVGLELALGRTQEQIAQKLGISRNTVIYHRRQLYNRLGVDTREQLLNRLQSA